MRGGRRAAGRGKERTTRSIQFEVNVSIPWTSADIERRAWKGDLLADCNLRPSPSRPP